MSDRQGKPKRIRTLGPGESPPEGVEPRRYRNDAGYMRLRWKVAPAEYVECYEHRWVTSALDPDVQVHHRNRIRDDNRPENLEVLDPRSHGEEHRRIDRAEVVRLYRTGLSTPEVGAVLGCTAPAVYRILVAEGVQPRTISESLRADVDDALIRRLHEAGVRSRRIADALGVSPSLVDCRVREMGLTPHREGRPTNAELDRAARALAAEGLAA